MQEYNEFHEREKNESKKIKYGLKEQPVIFNERVTKKYAEKTAQMEDLHKHKSALTQKAIEMLPDNLTGKKVIDIGCGEGVWSRFLAEKGANVIGVDLSIEMLKIAKERNRGLTNIKLINTEINNLDMLKENFDIAIISYVLNNVKNPEVAFERLNKIMKIGGEVIIIVKLFKYPEKNLEEEFRGYFLPVAINGDAKMYTISCTYKDYEKMIRENGFTIEECVKIDEGSKFQNKELEKLNIDIESVVIKIKKTTD